MEFNTAKMDGLFASTPPLEALKLIISDAATSSKEEQYEKIIMVNDVARAFFEAPATRQIAVELPPEDTEDGEDMVGLLLQSLYGTRDAARNFQNEVKKFLTGVGFEQGRYNTSTYLHRDRGIKLLVHGDDFVSQGGRMQVKWLHGKINDRFEIKTTMIGHGDGEQPEGRVLNRTIRATKNGWEFEADQRHAEVIVNSLNLQESKPVATPGEHRPWEEEEKLGNEILEEARATEYRAVGARGNYLSQDRPDLQYAVKEICRSMSKPSVADRRKLKRLGRYLKGRPRLVLLYPWSVGEGVLGAYSDSDWAGCRRTARSTSGGAIFYGVHLLKSWSATQKNITLSSAEAELVAAVKATTEALGIAQLSYDWGIELAVKVYIDSSAAIGIASRKGSGKMRHVRVGDLWIQELVEEEEIELRKVPGTRNPADAFTKNLPQKVMEEHLETMGAEFRDGRADTSLEVQRNVMILMRRPCCER